MAKVGLEKKRQVSAIRIAEMEGIQDILVVFSGSVTQGCVQF